MSDVVEIKKDARGAVLAVSAQPGARRNGIVGVRNGMLRVAVTAAAEKGKANRAIIEVLAEALDLPKSSIELVFGETTKQKRFLIIDGESGAIAVKIQSIVESNSK